MRIFLVILIILTNCWCFVAQDTGNAIPCKEVIYDLNEAKTPVTFNKEKIEALKNDSNFNYVVEKDEEGFWTTLKNWFKQVFQKLFRWLFDVEEITGFWSILFQTLPYLLILGLLAFITWLFMKLNPSNLYTEKQQNPEVILSEDEDIIENQDIEQLIADAISQKEYRAAVRYYYLSILKKLKEQELIIWEAQKTNTDYLTELQQPDLQQQFRKLTRSYDFIWYGSFPIDKPLFLQLETAFHTMRNAID